MKELLLLALLLSVAAVQFSFRKPFPITQRTVQLVEIRP